MSLPAVPMAPRRGVGAVRGLAVVGVAAFVLFMLSAAFNSGAPLLDPLGPNVRSRSPVGFAGLVELLKADGRAVSVADAAAAPPHALVILAPRIDTPVEAVRQAVAGRRALVILPKWTVFPDPLRPGRVTSAGVSDPQVVYRLAGAALGVTPARLGLSYEAGHRPFVALQGRQTIWVGASQTIKGFRTLSGPGLAAIVTDERGKPLVLRSASRMTAVLVEPDVVDDLAIADLRSARTATTLIERLAGDTPIVFDTALSARQVDRSALKLPFTPPYVAATVCAALAALFAALQGLASFGAVAVPPRAYAFGKRVLVDSAASLLAVANREPRMAPRYVELAREQAIAALALPHRLGHSETEAVLDRIGEARGAGAWSALAAAAKSVKTPAALMALARKTYGWRQEVGGGHS